MTLLLSYSGILIFPTLDFSNHGTFPTVLRQSNTVILPLIFRNSRYFEPILASLDILFLKLNQKLVN